MDTGSAEWIEQDITVEAERMLPLMARSLYPRPAAAVREMLANAVDALTRKRHLIDQEPRTHDGTLEVRVNYNEHDRTFTVTDTGIGMDWEDVQTYINQIGVSGTQAFRDKVEDRDVLRSLIGQFGIGLLACFKLGDRVRIRTRKLGSPPAEGVEWVAEGRQPKARMRLIERNPTGTEVEVIVTDPENAEFLREHWRSTVSEYGDLLAYPIHDLYNMQLNSFGRVPWETGQGEDEEALRSYIRERASEPINPPVWVIPITPTADADVRGVVYIPDDRSFVNLDGRVDLYCRRMLVRKACPGVLPDGLLFCDAVLDGAGLTMVMSREDVMRDRAFEQMRREVARQVYISLERLAARPQDFRRVQALFDREMKHGVLENDALFSAYADSLRFFTSSTQPQTLSAYRDEVQQRQLFAADPTSGEPVVVSGELTPAQRGQLETLRKTMIYVTTSSQQERFQIDQVLARRGLKALEVVPAPVTVGPDGAPIDNIEASLDYRVLRKYAQFHELELRPAEEAIDPFPDEPDERYRLIVQAFAAVLRDQNVNVRVSRFAPIELPVLVQYKRTHDLLQKTTQWREAIRRLKRDQGEDLETAQFEELLNLASRQAEIESRRFDLIINANNPTINKLAETVEVEGFPAVDADRGILQMVTIELYHSALQYTGYRPNDEAMGLILGRRLQLIEELLDYAGEDAANRP